LALDSRAIITRDTRIHAATVANLALIAGKDYWWDMPTDGLYRPVTTLSLLFNYAVLGNGPDATGYHVLNVLLHAVNVWLVFDLALLVLGSIRPAFLASALWAVHPVGTEAVSNVVGRADLLAALAVLGGLLLYVRGASAHGWRRCAVVAGLFVVAALGVFSKENASVLLGLMLLWDLSFGVRGGVPRLLRRWPCYAAVAAALGLFLWARHAVLGPLVRAPQTVADNPLYGADFWAARLTAIKVIGMELWLLLFPVKLSCDRSYNQIPVSSWTDPWAWAALIAVAAILALAVARYRRDRLSFWLAGFFGIALLPTANLIFPIGAIMAERFLYLPAVALAIALVALLDRPPGRRYATAILVAAGLLFAVRTFARNPAWTSNLALASADVETAPRSARLHDMLAQALFEQDPQGNIDRVIQEQERACEILFALPPAQASELTPTYLGIYYVLKAARVDDAALRRPWYQKALQVLLKAREISQAAEKAHDDRLRAQGEPLAARSAYQQLYFTLANVYLYLGRYQEAVEALRYGKALNPRALVAYDKLSMAYSAMGNLQWAAVSLEEKAQLDGFQRSTLAALLDVYRKAPDASCVLVRQGGDWTLNTACPRLRSDLCLALADLAQAYQDARQPGRAQATQTAAQQFGCPFPR
jgi:tetratricopeptide (TPR) repeat protein